MKKAEFEDYFLSNVLPAVEKRHERYGMIDKPARREAWNDSIDAWIRHGALPESAGNWAHPKWLETRRVTPLPNPGPVSLVQGIVTAGLAAVGVVGIVLGLRKSK